MQQGATTLRDALNRLDAAGLEPHHVALREPTLDDVFLTLTNAGAGTTASTTAATTAATTAGTAIDDGASE